MFCALSNNDPFFGKNNVSILKHLSDELKIGVTILKGQAVLELLMKPIFCIFCCGVIDSRSLLVDSCHSAAHILAVQWTFVSLGTVVDRRSFPLVAKGHRDFV